MHNITSELLDDVAIFRVTGKRSYADSKLLWGALGTAFLESRKRDIIVILQLEGKMSTEEYVKIGSRKETIEI